MENSCAKIENTPLRYLYKGKVVFDLDDTIFNFRKIDRKIITAIFKGNNVILALDKVLWGLNSLDILPNGMNGLLMRLWLYAIIAGMDPKLVFIQYEEMYKYELSNYDFSEFIELADKLREKGYIIEVRTNNRFAGEFKITQNIIVKHYTKNKTRKEDNTIKYVVGDKLSDLLAAQKCKSKFLYVKKSIYMKFIVAFTTNATTIKGDIYESVLSYIY